MFGMKLYLRFLAAVSLLLTILIQLAPAADYGLLNDKNLAPEVQHFAGPKMAGVDARGDMSLSIPLLTVPGRGLDFPLTLHYRAGIEVDQPASWVGLGWSLDLGSITRHPQGGFAGSPNVDFARSGGIDPVRQVDRQPDIYQVNFPAGSATLNLLGAGMTSVSVPYRPISRFVPTPWQTWKIDFTAGPVTVKCNCDSEGIPGGSTSTSESDYQTFTITTEDGARYLFGYPTLGRFQVPGGIDQDYVSTWRLLAILGPNYTGPTDYDLIGLGSAWARESNTLPDDDSGHGPGGNQGRGPGGNQGHGQGGPKPDTSTVQTLTVANTYSQGEWIKIIYTCVESYPDNQNPHRLTQLTYPKAIITPTHEADFSMSVRDDEDLKINGTAVHKRLDSITLYERENGGTVKSIVFDYAAGTARLVEKTTLLAVTEKSAANNALPGHRFDYYTLTDNANQWSAYKDGTSYYRDDFGFLRPGGVVSASSDPNLAKSWSLKKVTYPTGATDEFFYGSDSTASNTFPYKIYQGGAQNMYLTGIENTSVSPRQYWIGGARLTRLERNDGRGRISQFRYEYPYVGQVSGIPDRAWQRTAPFSVTGLRGQFGVYYPSIRQVLPDGSNMITYYKTYTGADRRSFIFYNDLSANFSVVAEDNKDWAWGAVERVDDVDISGNVVKKEEFYRQRYPDSFGAYAPIISYALNSGADGSPIYFASERLDSLVTTLTENGQTVRLVKSFEYLANVNMVRKEKVRKNTTTRITETTYAWEKYPDMACDNNCADRNRNLRAPAAQVTVWENSTAYSSTATTWRPWTVDGEQIYLPDKVYRWNGTPGAPPAFNFTSPPTSGPWEIHASYAQFDKDGNVTRYVGANGDTTRYYYGTNDTPFPTSFARLYWRGVYLTGMQRALGALDADPANPQNDLVTRYQYDMRWPGLSRRTDENGANTDYAYDDFGRLKEIRRSGNLTDSLFYAFSRTNTAAAYDSTRPNAITTRRYYGGAANYPATEYYDGLARLIQSQAGDGADDIVAAVDYDLSGRAWRQWKPYRYNTGHLYHQNYGVNANAWYDGAPGPNAAGMAYTETRYKTDPLDRPQSATPPGGGPAVTFDYGFATLNGAYHQAVRTTDETGRSSRVYTDAFGDRAQTVTGVGAADSVAVQMTYDPLGNARTIVNDGLTTTLNYSTLGRLSDKTSPDAGQTQYLYDKAGHVRFVRTARQAAANEFSQYTYDGLNRLTELGIVQNQTWPTNNPTATFNAAWQERYSYDADYTGMPNYAKGRLTKAEVNLDGDNPAESIRLLGYDVHGRLIRELITLESVPQFSLAYAYNRQDALDSLTYQGQTSLSLVYRYNKLGQLDCVLAGTDTIASYRYAPTGQTEQTRLGRGLQMLSQTYTVRDWPDILSAAGSPNNAFWLDLNYELNGNVSGQQWRAVNPAVTYGYAYNYDPLNRLRTARATGAFTAPATVGYRYDRRGNLLSLNRVTAGLNPDSLTQTHFYIAGKNWLDKFTTPTAPQNPGNYQYDASGNMTADASRALTGIAYNYLNLPVSLTKSGSPVNYGYDGQSQRLWKKNGATITWYVRTAAGHTLAELNGAGAVQYFNLLTPSGETIAQKRFDTTPAKDYYYLKDHLGSNRLTIRNDSGVGTVTAETDYDPFGFEIRNPGSATAEQRKFKFTGKERDTESGLDYFGARYYDSAIGVFRSVDPLDTKYPGISPYAYALNNPINNIDPDGRLVYVKDKQLKQIVNDTYRKSATFRKLYNQQRADPNVVHTIRTKGDAQKSKGYWARTDFTTETFENKTTKVIITTLGASEVDGSRVGHELQHGVEIASDDAIKTMDDYQKFVEGLAKEKKGKVLENGHVETNAAKEMGSKIYDELQSKSDDIELPKDVDVTAQKVIDDKNPPEEEKKQ